MLYDNLLEKNNVSLVVAYRKSEDRPFQKPLRLTLRFRVRASARLGFAHAVVYTAFLFFAALRSESIEK